MHGSYDDNNKDDDPDAVCNMKWTWDDEWFKKTITVRDIAQIDQEGDTYIYIYDTDGDIYCAKYADVIGMIQVREGDQITIEMDGSTFRLS